MSKKRNTANERRIHHAEETVRNYSCSPGCADEPDYESDIIDFLTDLRHFCASAGLDFESFSRMAEGHFDCEAEEEDPDDTETDS